jgi:hypothetical protein
MFSLKLIEIFKLIWIQGTKKELHHEEPRAACAATKKYNKEI